MVGRVDQQGTSALTENRTTSCRYDLTSSQAIKWLRRKIYIHVTFTEKCLSCYDDNLKLSIHDLLELDQHWYGIHYQIKHILQQSGLSCLVLSNAIHSLMHAQCAKLPACLRLTLAPPAAARFLAACTCALRHIMKLERPRGDISARNWNCGILDNFCRKKNDR